MQMASKRPKAEFVHIGPVLKRLLKDCEGTGGSQLVRIRQAWNQVLDAGVRDNAQPAAINKTTLLVHVTSSPWLHQLQFLKKDILSRLKGELPAMGLEDLLFKIGPL
jgi:hypothetical protein